MTDKAREEMSALMDGEATELELHRVLKCCEDDEELRASWRRYHVMRSVIRGETRDKNLLAGRSENAAMGFAAAVSQAIADEPAYQESTEPHKQRLPWVDTLLRPLGSVAVAASVSAMVIFGWQSTGVFLRRQPLPAPRLPLCRPIQCRHPRQLMRRLLFRRPMWRLKQRYSIIESRATCLPMMLAFPLYEQKWVHLMM